MLDADLKNVRAEFVGEVLNVPGVQPTGLVVRCAMARSLNLLNVLTWVLEQSRKAALAAKKTIAAPLVDGEHAALLCVLCRPARHRHVRRIQAENAISRSTKQTSLLCGRRAESRKARVFPLGRGARCDEALRLNEWADLLGQNWMSAYFARSSKILARFLDLDVSATRALPVVAGRQ